MLVITLGTLFVNVCVAEFHSKMPHKLSVKSNQYVALAGLPVGRTVVPTNSAVLTSALIM